LQLIPTLPAGHATSWPAERTNAHAALRFHSPADARRQPAYTAAAVEISAEIPVGCAARPRCHPDRPEQYSPPVPAAAAPRYRAPNGAARAPSAGSENAAATDHAGP